MVTDLCSGTKKCRREVIKHEVGTTSGTGKHI
jgi:hypothetical protein